MRYLLRYRKMLALVMLLSFVCVSGGLAPAQAGLISTAQVLDKEEGDADRSRIKAFIDREEVRSQLNAYGLDAEMAKEQVDRLTDAEVARMAQELDRMPAGGDTGVAIVVSALIVFLVLLATDIMGYTDVFPFVTY